MSYKSPSRGGSRVIFEVDKIFFGDMGGGYLFIVWVSFLFFMHLPATGRVSGLRK
jgi:hypothetical protein